MTESTPNPQATHAELFRGVCEQLGEFVDEMAPKLAPYGFGKADIGRCLLATAVGAISAQEGTAAAVVALRNVADGIEANPTGATQN